MIKLMQKDWTDNLAIILILMCIMAIFYRLGRKDELKQWNETLENVKSLQAQVEVLRCQVNNKRGHYEAP